MKPRVVLLLFLLSAPLYAETPLVLGHTYTFDSAIMADQRRVMVALPERYHASKRRYPTLYVIDADFHFDYVAATARNLARMGKIPPLLVVGVATNGQADYIQTSTWSIAGEQDYGGAEVFQSYLAEELVPRIDRQFRTSGDRAIAGFSLGGLTVLQSWLATNSPFNAFLAMSPSVWFDDYAIQTRAAKRLAGKNAPDAPLFLSLANERQMGVRELVETLDTQAPQPLRWAFKHYPEETHFSTALPALMDGLTFLTPNHFIDMRELMQHADYSQVFDLFVAKQSQWAGYQFDWLQAYTLGKYFAASQQLDRLPEAMAKARQLFPESHTELVIQAAKAMLKADRPAEAQQLLHSAQAEGELQADWHQQLSKSYYAQGQDALAKKHHQQALALAKQHQLASWEWWELEP